MAQSTSIQRVQRLIDSVPLTNLLFNLLSTSYKKVQSLQYTTIFAEFHVSVGVFVNYMLLFHKMEFEKNVKDRKG